MPQQSTRDDDLHVISLDPLMADCGPTTLHRPRSMLMTAPAQPAPPCGPATVKLRYQPRAARAARQLVQRKLVEWNLDELIDAAELIITELVSNAVKTGCQTFMVVKVRRPTETTIRISVRDGSRAMPVLVRARENEECHRGLHLVHTLTEGQWGVTPDAFGKTVYASLRRHSATPTTERTPR
ncbi:ATP-binding protein [Kitasatospora aureofaciens]|uniref:ATP-binding protein n=1 Tax=Kitasatospora aureofaciens TaxID=1894 RepID=UPI00068CF480|nr:ATP-binding protein [Kitasatospora aureofaciens]